MSFAVVGLFVIKFFFILTVFDSHDDRECGGIMFKSSLIGKL